MAWTRRSTTKSVDVDLDEFDAGELLQGLIDARWLSPDEAEAIQLRAKTSSKVALAIRGSDTEALDEARRSLRRGNKQEALIHVERFLGNEWIGNLQ